MEENKSAGITLKQVKFIETLAKRDGHELPYFDDMSMDDAKKLISEWLNNSSAPSEKVAEDVPKSNFDPNNEFHVVIDLLRQILAELRKQ